MSGNVDPIDMYPESSPAFEDDLPKIDFSRVIDDSRQQTIDALKAVEAANAAPPSQVDHPPHYGGADNPYEAIKVIEAWLTPEQFYGFLIGTSLKYYARAGKKAGESAAKDLAKADWYTRRAAKHKEMNP